MKNKNPDSGLLLISLLMTIVVAIAAGLLISAESRNPIETLMFFVRDGFTVADTNKGGDTLDNETTPEDPPEFIPPDISLPDSNGGDTPDIPESSLSPESSASPDTTVKPSDTTKPSSTTKPAETTKPETTTKPAETTKPSTTTKPAESTKPEETTKPAVTTKPGTTQSPISDENYFSDTLFLGDSRTVGFYLYARIPSATYFARTSMNVYNVFDSKVSETSDTSKYTLPELLTQKKFGKIYILLGINEIGYSYSSVVSNYSKVIEYIQMYQPEAKIIIQSNMHVTKAKSDANPNTFSNTRINELNRRLSELADNKKVFYLSFEKIFDDASGNMSTEYSGDGVHLYAKCYKLWRDWILQNGKLY